MFQLPTTTFSKKLSTDQTPLPRRDSISTPLYSITSPRDITIPKKSFMGVCSDLVIEKIPTGIWIQCVQPDYFFKNKLQLETRVIDCKFKGELDFFIYNGSDEDYTLHKGDVVCQLAYLPLLVIEPVWKNENE